MSKTLTIGSTAALAVAALVFAAASAGPFSPGRRTLVLAHNAYPDKDQWTDRLDRAISAGAPFAVEIDLIWGLNPKTGKYESLITHNAKAIDGSEPTLKTYFFERVRPIVEKALKANNKKDWPLITLYLDIKNDPPEHLQALWSEVGEYESWLTTAVKTNNPAELSPLDRKPVMVLVEDKPDDIKQEVLYDRLPVGAKLRMFGTAHLNLPPTKDLTKRQVAALLVETSPDKLVTEPATNYRRWWGIPWRAIEKGAQDKVGDWTPEQEASLKAAVDHAHKLGYLVSLWVLDGFEPAAGKAQGWGEEYNFGSLDKAVVRWKAAAKAGADFVSTDQYEEVAKVIKVR